jgi:potassium uptake TrkH family protein
MSLRSIRERVNILIFNSKDRVLNLLNILSIPVSLIAVASLIWYHGYDIDPETAQMLVRAVELSFGFYILKFLFGFFYSFQPLQYLKESKLEGILLGFILLDMISNWIFGVHGIKWFGEQIGMTNLISFYVLFIQLYFLVIVLIELTRAGGIFRLLRLSPPALLILSFLILIVSGTALLLLPEMSVSSEHMHFADALFTSISASCVTGLVVVDTASYFTTKGQFIIMVLMQLGGLNIISFASVIALFGRSGIGLTHQSILKENMSGDSLLSTRKLIRQIFLFSFVLELIGAVLIFMLWGPKVPFNDLGDRIFHSIFHSISAFNNAGFSLFSDGLFETYLQKAYLLHIVIALLIFMGGLGFPVMQDLFDPKRMRERAAHPWRAYRVSTKIALYASIILVLFGAATFFFAEMGNTMSGMNFGERVITSIFQSITTRTAGFNTVDIGSLGRFSLILFMFLMFIGASSASTGGGIKTSTFTAIFLSAFSTIRGKKRPEFLKHTFTEDTIFKAHSIFLFSATFVFVMIGLLSLTEPDIDILRLAFEEVSAFATVGLTTGITSELSMAGRVIIMASMFIGRIGTLTLFIALSNRRTSSAYTYPSANLIVG